MSNALFTTSAVATIGALGVTIILVMRFFSSPHRNVWDFLHDEVLDNVLWFIFRLYFISALVTFTLAIGGSL